MTSIAKKLNDKGARKQIANFPIVGVGASAGGLEAFTQLLKHLPTTTGMAFVLVQHLDPNHESALSEILGRATSMPVREVTNDLRVEANHVYVIPPNTNMGIDHGILRLDSRRNTHKPHHSIDSFFESLAEEMHERAIGVILSGTASDGTLGLEAIKAEGGITFAQDESARYDSMPQNAIAAGCVDFVLSPEDIVKELTRIAKHPYVSGGAVASETEVTTKKQHRAKGSKGERISSVDAEQTASQGEVVRGGAGENSFKKILLLLRNHSGVDFSLYKSGTIRRRIARRMLLSEQETYESYLKFLRDNSKELSALYADMLISVTSFFRNPDAFDVLTRKIFPKLLQQRAKDPLRIWVLGCSTGQEAYSIAMAAMEASENLPHVRKIQIFATDLNEVLLDKARHGLYPKNITVDVSTERLQRFFVEEDGGYRINKRLREMVVFARQNLITDPPFSHIDLISCRNLLIYLEPRLQKLLFPTFHFALNPNGFLFLGASESIGLFSDLFEPLDRKYKVYVKKGGLTPKLDLPVKKAAGNQRFQGQFRLGEIPPPRRQGVFQQTSVQGINAQIEADRVTINQFAPPGVLINAELQILQFRGQTGAYLQPPPTGRAVFDVLKMARDGLMLPLRSAINKAIKENKTARAENVGVQQNDKTRMVNVEVIPLKNLQERCFLVLFQDVEEGATSRADTSLGLQKSDKSLRSRAATKKGEARRVAGLERELSETRDYLQFIREEHEAASEELQSSTEEVQSANEELQSINEELETSKEELESTNEELTTINEEMANRNTELSRLNSDLINLQTSTKLVILLLKRDLTIRRFSEEAKKQFNLQASDIGRPINNIRHNLALPDLESIIVEVIARVREHESEVQDKNGRWYSMLVRPYLTLDNKVDGAVMTLMDIDSLKRSEQSIKESRDFAESILSEVSPLLILDQNLRVLTANQSFYKQFKVIPTETEHRLIYELGDGQWNIPHLRTLLEDILPRKSYFENFEITHDFPSIGRRTIFLHARQVDSLQRILLGLEDVTERLFLQNELRRSEMRYRRLFEAAKDGVLIVNPTTRKIIDANPFMTELLGYAREDLCGKELFEIGLIKDEDANRAAFRELKARGSIRYANLPLKTRQGKLREVEVVSNLYEEDGVLIVQCNIRDITERRRAEDALHHAQDQLKDRANLLQGLVEKRTTSLQSTTDQLETFVYSIAHDLRAPLRAMQGFAQILKEDYHSVLDEVGIGYTEKITSAAQNLDQLLGDLLEYSRISQTKVELQSIQLAPVLAAAIAECRPIIEKANAHVTVERPLPVVLAHAPTLNQALINLLSNSLKFVPPSVQPHIRLRTEDRDGAIRLWVEDNGIGIEPEQLERIFRIFERGHNKDYPGTGVGLAIVKKSIERMGGRVGVESTPGGGSRFWIELQKETHTSYGDTNGS